MSSNGNAVAGPSRHSRRDSNESDEEDRKKPIIEDEEANKYTIEDFVNVPVGTADDDLKPLREVKGKLQSIIGRIENGINLARETAVAVEEASKDDDMIDKIQIGLLRALDEMEQLTFRINAIDEVITRLKNGEDIPDLFALYEEKATAWTEEYMAKTMRTRFKDNETFTGFRQAIWEVNHGDEPCPPVKRWLPRSDGDESDDDIEVGGTLQTFKCPITLMIFKDAAKSTVCGHSYDYEAIMGHIRSAKKGKRPCKCPVSGCPAVLTENDVIRDSVMQKRAAAYKARLERSINDDKDDEQYVTLADD